MEVEMVVVEGSPAQGTCEQRLEVNRLFWDINKDVEVKKKNPL